MAKRKKITGRQYLKEGDEVFCEGAFGTFNKDRVVKFSCWDRDSSFYHDGYVVQFDKDGKPFIEP